MTAVEEAVTVMPVAGEAVVLESGGGDGGRKGGGDSGERGSGLRE